MLPDSPTLTAMLAAATPGEWVYDPARVYRGVDGYVPVPLECVIVGEIAIAATGLVDDKQSVADARLMALAPALAAEVIRLRATVETLSQATALAARGTIILNDRIKLALEILDDPADPVEGICRATEALWGESPVVPAQVGDK